MPYSSGLFFVGPSSLATPYSSEILLIPSRTRSAPDDEKYESSAFPSRASSTVSTQPTARMFPAHKKVSVFNSTERSEPMRRAWLFAFGVTLFSSVLGCHPCHHTAGVCDCDPPPVGAVLYGRPPLAQPAPPVATGAPGVLLPADPHFAGPYSGIPGTPSTVPETLRVKPVPNDVKPVPNDTSIPPNKTPRIDEIPTPRP
jgi:hypothetical protein